MYGYVNYQMWRKNIQIYVGASGRCNLDVTIVV